MNAQHIFITLIMTLAWFSGPGLALAAEMPEQVTIAEMGQYFDAVEFDHTMHTELGEDCSACHHHTTGTGTNDERCVRCHADSDAAATVGCRDCHVAEPFSAAQINREAEDRYQFHIDKPGLKAAYHWNCLGCHAEMDGPTDCQDCHAKTPEGEAFYHDDARTTATGASDH